MGYYEFIEILIKGFYQIFTLLLHSTDVATMCLESIKFNDVAHLAVLTGI